MNMGKISRRDWLKLGAAGLTATVLTRDVLPASGAQTLYVGTYTASGKSEGIYICRFDPASGEITRLGVEKGVADPSFLTVDGKKKYLYAVNELVEYEGKKSGAVSAFAIDRKSGGLQLINNQPSLGGAPCHVTVSKNGRFVLVANYLGGNVAVYPVRSDGGLGESVDLEQHVGTGPNKDRQEAPHAHSITLSPSNRFAFAADLGNDRLMNYAFDAETGKLETNPQQPFFAAKPGAGPRHFAFHPNGRFAYLINELSLSVTGLIFDQKSGVFTEIETVPVVEKPNSGSTCADVHVSPDGNFLYGSVRGHNEIAAFRIDPKNGKLSSLGNVSTGGRKPRNFAIEPSGNFLLVANQDSDNIVVFRIGTDGRLTATGKSIDLPVPVCLRFV